MADRAGKKAKDSAMAAMMKEHGPRAPAQWHGCGSDDRKMAERMGGEWRNKPHSTWERGMLGGMLAFKCGMTAENPMDNVAA